MELSVAVASERSVALTVTPVWPSTLEAPVISAVSAALLVFCACAAAPAAAPPMPAAIATATESGAAVRTVCEVAVTATAPPFASTFAAAIRAEVTALLVLTASAAEKVRATAT